MPSAAPSRARNVVLWFAVTLAIITYVDRICISQAAPTMQKELNLSKTDMGWVFAAFGLSYAIFEMPGGWLGDRFGPRKVLMRVVCMWSIFTVATGWARNFWTLIICRFFFGMGEAGCFPNITIAFTNWFPIAERVRAQGILWLSARWGGAFTPLLVGWMLASGSNGGFGLGWHYKWVFLLFGMLGIVWAILFYQWFRDNPKDHLSVNEAELAHIGDNSQQGHHSIPWGKLFASRTVWMLWAQYCFMSFGWYFFITWFPTYLKEEFADLSDMQRALLATLPLFFAGTGSIISGLFSAALDRKLKSIALTRRVLGVGGMGLAGVMLLASTQFNSPVAIVVAIGLGALCNDLAMPGAWGACMDVGGRHTGALSGSMNTMGQIGGIIGPIAVSEVLKVTNNNWTLCIALFALSYFLGAICWAFINSDDRLHD